MRANKINENQARVTVGFLITFGKISHCINCYKIIATDFQNSMPNLLFTIYLVGEQIKSSAPVDLKIMVTVTSHVGLILDQTQMRLL
jgi:hypothetical protein